VGGTGLYFDVLTKGLSPIPPVPEEVREATRIRFEEIGRDAFFGELARRDPVAASKLRISDTQRVLRAMDVLEATGRSLAEWQSEAGKPVLAGFSVRAFVLAPPRDVLHARIGRRFEHMVEQGALGEAGNLIGLAPDLPAARALGLNQLQKHVKGELSLPDAITEAQLATRQYVKRQMTWFRNRMKDWTWLDDANSRNIIS
jgi:tRNA dimethylallyltransferase